jgi:hypothetical protein
MLNAVEREQIAKALFEWAESVPDQPMVGFLGRERLLTPREVVKQVSEKTPDGQAVLEILEHGVRREGIERVVARLTRRGRQRLRTLS